MRKFLLIIGRVLLGAVFVYAAWTKIRQPSYILFAMAIHSYQLVPEWAELAMARELPWLELALGVALLSGILLRYSAAAASVLLAVFFGVMTRSYLAGQQINCGCFGIGEALSPKTLVRDGLLLAVSFAVTFGAFFAARAPGKSPDPAPPSPAAQTAAE
jgi:uncharacterized membrane protein YphA (DoxX/SURF4 family)